jgi:uncharacterized protein YdiU (UPF0061 family)
MLLPMTEIEGILRRDPIVGKAMRKLTIAETRALCRIVRGISIQHGQERADAVAEKIIEKDI